MDNLLVFSDLTSSLLEMLGFVFLVRLTPLGLVLLFLPERRKLGLWLAASGILLGIIQIALALILNPTTGTEIRHE